MATKTTAEAFNELKESFTKLKIAIRIDLRVIWREVMKKFKPRSDTGLFITVKFKGQKIDIETMETHLKKIGFSLSWRGCDHYAIVNPNGNTTNLMIYGTGTDLRLEDYIEERMFGDQYGGSLYMKLNDLEISIGGDALSFEANKEAFILLHKLCKYDKDEKKKVRKAADKQPELRYHSF